jgi:hypothetical protein
MSDYWKSSVDSSAQEISLETLKEAFEKMQSYVHYPCGSEQRPHMLSNKMYQRKEAGEFAVCYQCGMVWNYKPKEERKT